MHPNFCRKSDVEKAIDQLTHQFNRFETVIDELSKKFEDHAENVKQNVDRSFSVMAMRVRNTQKK